MIKKSCQNDQYLQVLALKETPVGIGILRGKKYVITFANPLFCLFCGKKQKNIIGKPLFDAIPEVRGQGFESLLKNVLQIGIPYIGSESPVQLKRHGQLETGYFSFVFNPIRDTNGKVAEIMIIAIEVTEKVLARQKITESEKNLANILESISDAFIAYDTKWRFVYVNHEAERILGKKSSELIGKVGWDIFPEFRSTEAGKNFLKAAKTKKPVFFQTFYKPLQRWFDTRVYPGKNGFTTTFRDITQIKKTEQDLMINEQRFRTLIDKSTDVIQLLSSEGKIMFTSDSVKHVLGYSPDEILGHTGVPYLHPEDASRFYEVFGRLLEKSGNQETLEYRVKHKNGSWVWIEATGVNHLHNPAVNAIVGNFRDITQRKLLEQQKEEFLGIASHELKTPVTSLKAFTQVLQERFVKIGDEKSAHLLGKMDAQINKLTNLIQDLLDVSKVENDRFQLHKTKFSVDIFIKEIVEEVQRITDIHTIIIRGTINKQIYSDRKRIGQVLTNLLTNAVKYSQNGSQIVVSSKVNKNMVIISVKDYGIGIAKVNLSNIFDRFFRASAHRFNTVPGMGLGLNIASEIIKRHNGKIWVKSVEGKGSTFYFSLPLVNIRKRSVSV